jgi:hypothetical protein
MRQPSRPHSRSQLANQLAAPVNTSGGFGALWPNELPLGRYTTYQISRPTNCLSIGRLTCSINYFRTSDCFASRKVFSSPCESINLSISLFFSRPLSIDCNVNVTITKFVSLSRLIVSTSLFLSSVWLCCCYIKKKIIKQPTTTNPKTHSYLSSMGI